MWMKFTLRCCRLWTLLDTYDHVPGLTWGVLWVLRGYGVLALLEWLIEYHPVPIVRAVSVLSAWGQTRFQWVFGSARLDRIPCHRFCLWFSWIGSQAQPVGAGCAGLGSSELLLSSLQMMCFFWLHQAVNFSTHCGLQSYIMWRVRMPQVKEFNNLGVLLIIKGKMDCEIDRQIGAASVVMQTLYWSIVVKRSVSQIAKLLIYQWIHVPTITNGRDLWEGTKRKRLVQAADVGVLTHPWRCREVQTSRGSFNYCSFVSKGTRLRWFRPLIIVPPGCLPFEVYKACLTGRSPQGRSTTHRRDYVSYLAWEHLRIHQEELETVAGEWDFWTILHSLQLPQPLPWLMWESE